MHSASGKSQCSLYVSKWSHCAGFCWCLFVAGYFGEEGGGVFSVFAVNCQTTCSGDVCSLEQQAMKVSLLSDVWS